MLSGSLNSAPPRPMGLPRGSMMAPAPKAVGALRLSMSWVQGRIGSLCVSSGPCPVVAVRCTSCLRRPVGLPCYQMGLWCRGILKRVAFPSRFVTLLAGLDPSGSHAPIGYKLIGSGNFCITHCNCSIMVIARRVSCLCNCISAGPKCTPRQGAGFLCPMGPQQGSPSIVNHNASAFVGLPELLVPLGLLLAPHDLLQGPNEVRA